MKNQSANDLWAKYLRGECSPDECAQIESWYNQEFEKPIEVEHADFELAKSQMWQRILIQQVPAPVSANPDSVKQIRWPLFAAAASILLVLGLTLYFFVADKAPTRHQLAAHKSKIFPGSNKAVLTLIDGEDVNLSDTKSGIVIEANSLTYNDGSSLAAGIAGSKDNLDDNYAKYNQNQLMLKTPNGGTYQLVLPDGSKIWLNAASSVRFPSNFSGLKSRTVEITGEAYFEVAKDKTRPFIVKTQTQSVEVLGTHFNVNDYRDEGLVKTTLIEGAVKVHRSGSVKNFAILKPGQQSLFNGEQIKVNDVDAQEAIAWKNGKFQYSSATLEEIMKQVARWYDVEIEYKDDIRKKRFTGTVSRYDDISELLKTLSLTDLINFRIEGRKIIISK